MNITKNINKYICVITLICLGLLYFIKPIKADEFAILVSENYMNYGQTTDGTQTYNNGTYTINATSPYSTSYSVRRQLVLSSSLYGGQTFSFTIKNNHPTKTMNIYNIASNVNTYANLGAYSEYVSVLPNQTYTYTDTFKSTKTYCGLSCQWKFERGTDYTNDTASPITFSGFDSEWSLTIGDKSIGSTIELDTPTISITNNRITWNSIPNATSYAIYSVVSGNVGHTIWGITDTYYDVNSVATYKIKAQSNLDGYSDSEWSNEVYYNGQYSSILDTPNLTSQGATLHWSTISGASEYWIYRDGYHVDNTTSTSYTCDYSGSYQIQAISSTQGVNNSQLSSISTVNVGIDSPTIKPTTPTNETILDWLKYFIDLVEYYVTSIFNGLVNLLSSSANSIGTLLQYINTFVSSFGDLFSFIPTDLRAIFISIITITMLFAVVKFFRG